MTRKNKLRFLVFKFFLAVYFFSCKEIYLFVFLCFEQGKKIE